MGVFTGTLLPLPAGVPLRASQLQTIADAIGALAEPMQTWTPQWTNLTPGSGTQVYRYTQVGVFVFWRLLWTFGTGAAVGSGPRFTLPVPMHPSIAVADSGFPGEGSLLDPGIARRQPLLVVVDAQTVEIRFWNSTPTDQNVTATAPWTWATGDKIDLWGVYEGA